MTPVNADAATVNGLAKYNFLGHSGQIQVKAFRSVNIDFPAREKENNINHSNK